MNKDKLKIGMIVANIIHDNYCQNLTSEEIEENKIAADGYIDTIFEDVKNNKNITIIKKD